MDWQQQGMRRGCSPVASGDWRHPLVLQTARAPFLLQDERTPLAAAFSSRPHHRAGQGAAGPPTGGAGGLLGPATAQRGGSSPAALPQQTAAQQAVTQSLLAAKDSEAALLRQQLQQLTADFKFNLKVRCHRQALPLRFGGCCGQLCSTHAVAGPCVSRLVSACM